MTFIEPAFLWGALAVVIPIAIHFWHQKRGKPLPWAATRWLSERDQQQSRGLRLDNRWLLLVRCLLLALLAVLLTQPLANWLGKQPDVQRIHLVQPNPVVNDNFRFELAEARKKGERVYWADDTADDFKPASRDRTGGPAGRYQRPYRFDALTLQSSINQLPPDNTELHLYVVNSPALTDVPAILVPKRFRLHTVVDSSDQPRPYLPGKEGEKLFINRAGLLTSNTTPNSVVPLQNKPIRSGPIRVWLEYKNAEERQTVRAALNALIDVYGLDLLIDEKPPSNRHYDWVLTDRVPARPNLQTLYVVSEIGQSATNNVVFTNETLTSQTSERVANGQLPEWLGEQLIRHYGLAESRRPLPQRALNALFVPSTKPDQTQQQAGVQDALTLLFVVLLIIERALALTRNA